MAIYYVPGEAGWNDTSLFGANAQLRLKLETSYDNALNRSTISLGLQARLPGDSGNYFLSSDSELGLNGSSLTAGSGAYICFGGTGNWYSLTDGQTGHTVAWTATVDHAADGTASVSLTVHLRLYKDANLYLTCYGKSAVQAIDETRHFTLTLSAGAGCSIDVTRGGLSLADGAALSYGDALSLHFAAQSGYVLLTHTLNGSPAADGSTHTVTGDVLVAATARRRGRLRYDTGSALVSCQVLLDTGSALLPVRLFLDRGDRITEAGT